MNETATTFDQALAQNGLKLVRQHTEILQINVGKLCNLTCSHCHVNAGPARKEIITRATLERILEWLKSSDIPTVDLTGGAPEMIPDFLWLIEQLTQQGRHIIDRCNLTILLEPGYEKIPDHLAAHRVEIVASMPCYSPENVNAQRGDGVFDASIQALQLLNRYGYGIRDDLPLHLVYNPIGAKLPGPQKELEADYKQELLDHFNIRFHRLYCITNMPVSRFASWLKNNNQLADYMELLRGAFNPGTVEGLMCRNTLNVSWKGEVYDCDFNQQLGMQLQASHHSSPLHVWDIQGSDLKDLSILTGNHCFGCTAGTGSSCGGSVL
jgi:radical SAM/Cys-rich protein